MHEAARSLEPSMPSRLSTFASLAAALSLLAASQAHAALKVVSTISTLGELAQEVGGDRVEVKALSKGFQDPHFVEPKPSLMLQLNKAELLLHVGLELEIGWLPPLLLGARNPRIQSGEPGNLDCSASIPLLDIPTGKVDRSMGDVHPQGNPHYWIPPKNARILARTIAARLSLLDPEGKQYYSDRLAAFEAKVDAKEKEWAPLVARARGKKVATYHKSWSYVSDWLGLVEVGYVEPKPGIPPDPSHLVQLIATMKKEGAQLLLMESFYNKVTAQMVADKSGARLLTLDTDVLARPELKTWFEVTQHVLETIAQ
jgi:zinc/manganese transport system substrate-binding protein